MKLIYLTLLLMVLASCTTTNSHKEDTFEINQCVEQPVYVDCAGVVTNVTYDGTAVDTITCCPE